MTMPDKAKRFAKSLYARFKDDDVPSVGAQLTYYLILSFFPFLIFLVSVLSFFQLSGDSALNEFIRLLPADTGESLRKTLAEVTENRNGAVLSFGMLGTIWAASSGVGAIMKGLNKAYDEKETRPFWKVRGISVLSTLVLAVVILVSMLLLVFGQVLGEYLFRFLGFPDGFTIIWRVAQIVLPVLAMFGVFALLYWATPDRRLKFREVLPGAAFAALGWIVSSLLFSIYVNQFANYSKTYGSLGGIIVLLVWLYISSIIIMLGGEINATLAFDKSGKAKRPAQIKRYAAELSGHATTRSGARS